MVESINIGIITQARMTSTRLPGKVFMQINGNPLLKYHTDRLLQAGFRLVIATTTNKTDDIICEFAEKESIDFYRGDEQNVLNRFFNAAEKFRLNVIVRVTSDCPLIDPHLIRNNVEKYIRFSDDNIYMSNSIERTFARGFDFEIFSFRALKHAMERATDPTDLEHVTPYLWKNKPGSMQMHAIKQQYDHSHLRITVDTKEDFELVKKLIGDYQAQDLSWMEIENILLQHPELVAINANVEQKKV